MKDRNQAKEKRALGRAFFAQHMLEAAHFERAGFHMPGHRGGNVYPASLKEHFLDLDLTELPITEDLNDPGPVLRDVEKQWGRALGGSDLMFLTAGSSCGIKGGLFALAGFQGDVIALSPVHKAYFQAASLLNLTTLYLPQDEALAKAYLEAAPSHFKPTVFYLTSPDYFGAVLDLPRWIKFIRQYYPAIEVLVDEAHGAHFPWLKDMPQAIHLGATLTIKSTHKTLPAPTPSAIALAKPEGLIDKVREGVQLFGTSSPPLAYAAAIDYALAYMEVAGEEELARLQRLWEGVLDALKPYHMTRYAKALVHSSIPPLAQDPTRLALDVSQYGSGFAAEKFLASQGIAVEMADPARILLLSYIAQPEEEFERLTKALITWAKEASRRHEPHKLNHEDKTDDKRYEAFDAELASLYEKALSRAYFPETQGFAPRAQKVYLKQERNRQGVIPYPPGLGIYAPGETVDPELVQRLRQGGVHV